MCHLCAPGLAHSKGTWWQVTESPFMMVWQMKGEFIGFCNGKAQCYLQAWLHLGVETMSSGTSLYSSHYSSAKNHGHCVWNKNKKTLKRNKEKADWLGTLGPKERHGGKFSGLSFDLHILDLEPKKPETQKTPMVQTKRGAPQNFSQPKDQEREA